MVNALITHLPALVSSASTVHKRYLTVMDTSSITSVNILVLFCEDERIYCNLGQSSPWLPLNFALCMHSLLFLLSPNMLTFRLESF